MIHLRSLIITSLTLLCASQTFVSSSGGSISVRANNGNVTTGSTNDTQPSSSDSDATTTAPSSSLPSARSSLFINTRKPALGNYMTDPVFSENSLQMKFKTCSFQTPVNSSQCFQDDPYNDRLEFLITFSYDVDVIRAAFNSKPPKLSTASFASALASSTVSYDVHDDETTASVTVMYLCNSHNHGVVPLRLSLHITDDSDDDIDIYWQKVCASGSNDKMLYGYLTGNAESDNQEQHQFGRQTSALLQISPTDISTEFFLKLDQEGAQQIFLAPYVKTNSDIVSITLRGTHPQGSVLDGLRLITFQIGYDCKKKGEAKIEATIGIPPFKNVSAVWLKDCGGKEASSLQVGSTLGAFDIVDDGKPTPKYMVAVDNIGTEHSEEHFHFSGNDSVTSWEFFIKNDDNPDSVTSDSALHIGRITATVERAEVLYNLNPSVWEWDSSWRQSSKSAIALHAGKSLKVRMMLVCRGLGESRVLITIPLLDYKPLEFGVAKECLHVGESHKANEFILTVGKVFWIGVLSAICLMAFLYWRRRHLAKGASFVAVPVTER